MADSYTCAACGGIFEKTTSDREQEEELWRYFFGSKPVDWIWLREFIDEHCKMVCDDCYPKVMAHASPNQLDDLLEELGDGPSLQRAH